MLGSRWQLHGDQTTSGAIGEVSECGGDLPVDVTSGPGALPDEDHGARGACDLVLSNPAHHVVAVTAVDVFGILVAALVETECADLIEVALEAPTPDVGLQLIGMMERHEDVAHDQVLESTALGQADLAKVLQGKRACCWCLRPG